MLASYVFRLLFFWFAARYDEYQKAKAQGKLLMSDDEVAVAAARELANAKANEMNGDDSDSEDVPSGTKRGRSAHGDEADIVPGVEDGDSDFTPDKELLQEIASELELESAADGGRPASGAHRRGDGRIATGLDLFASQDVQIGHHNDYIAREDWEVQASSGYVYPMWLINASNTNSSSCSGRWKLTLKRAKKIKSVPHFSMLHMLSLTPNTVESAPANAMLLLTVVPKSSHCILLKFNSCCPCSRRVALVPRLPFNVFCLL